MILKMVIYIKKVIAIGCWFLAVGVGFASCARQEAAPTTDEEQASAAALQYYEALYGGQPEVFLNHRILADSMPDDYRRQLLDCYERHLSQVSRKRHGVNRVEVSRAEKAADLGIMQVFLVLSFGDGTCEEVVVPMAEREGQWMLK